MMINRNHEPQFARDSSQRWTAGYRTELSSRYEALHFDDAIHAERRPEDVPPRRIVPPVDRGNRLPRGIRGLFRQASLRGACITSFVVAAILPACLPAFLPACLPFLFPGSATAATHSSTQELRPSKREIPDASAHAGITADTRMLELHQDQRNPPGGSP